MFVENKLVGINYLEEKKLIFLVAMYAQDHATTHTFGAKEWHHTPTWKHTIICDPLLPKGQIYCGKHSELKDSMQYAVVGVLQGLLFSWQKSWLKLRQNAGNWRYGPS